MRYDVDFDLLTFSLSLSTFLVAVANQALSSEHDALPPGCFFHNLGGPMDEFERDADDDDDDGDGEDLELEEAIDSSEDSMDTISD